MRSIKLTALGARRATSRALPRRHSAATCAPPAPRSARRGCEAAAPALSSIGASTSARPMTGRRATSRKKEIPRFTVAAMASGTPEAPSHRFDLRPGLSFRPRPEACVCGHVRGRLRPGACLLAHGWAKRTNIEDLGDSSGDNGGFWSLPVQLKSLIS